MTRNEPGIERAIKILYLLAERGGIRQSEIKNRLGYAKSTVSGDLSRLCKAGFIEIDPMTGRYSLGLSLLTLSSQVLKRFSYTTTYVKPNLKKLVEESSDPKIIAAHFARLHQGTVIYIERAENPGAGFILKTYIGQQVSIHTSASGKVLLAFLDEERKNQLIKHLDFRALTSHTFIRNESQLREELDAIYNAGYATDIQETFENNCCIGVPLFDLNRKVFAALEVSCIAKKFSPKDQELLVSKVKATAKQIEEELQYHNVI